MSREVVEKEFIGVFGSPPEFVVRAPGRVNLIGDHTDYNGGFVLPMALERSLWLAVRRRPDGVIQLSSRELERAAGFSVDSLDVPQGDWLDLARGVAWAMAGHGEVSGFDGAIVSDVPVGSGLASSHAFQVALTLAIDHLGRDSLDPVEVAKVCLRADNEWRGIGAGIMDQMASAASIAGHALLIDCRSLQLRAVPVSPEVSVVIAHTGTRRDLSVSDYAIRVGECRRAADLLGVPQLRDLTIDALEAGVARLETPLDRRVRHVVTENDRTVRAAALLEAGDLAGFGELLSASHRSLAADYEVSTVELDAMVAVAGAHPACFGARLTGAGFGGAAVCVVRKGGVEDFIRHLSAGYEAGTGLQAEIWEERPGAGAAVVES